MAIGAIPIGLVVALGFYFVTRAATSAFRDQRRKRLAERARRRAAAANAMDARMAASS
jgi:uncharacterized protein (DUF2062 family)